MTHDPDLSILIPTLPQRAALLRRLRTQLEPQVAARPTSVEVLTLMDDGAMPTGTKRNQLVQMACGRYVAFVDDDDRISPDYIQTLLDGIQSEPDAVCIRGVYKELGTGRSGEFIDIPYQPQGCVTSGSSVSYLRGIQHLDAVRRDIALAVPYPAKWIDEDREWTRAMQLTGKVEQWREVDHPIYHYDDLTPKPVATSPRLAIVMPCYGHAEVTLACVESLMEATAEPSFRLILIDDCSPDDGLTLSTLAELQARFPDRITLRANSANIGVNASWNLGVTCAYHLNAEYVAIVNNDLVFSPGWDTALIASLADSRVGVVSPMSTFGPTPPPDWPRGGMRQVNPAGYLGYMPLLGAAFAMRLSLWDRLGPIPETMRIYWGDNWIAQATQRLGMLVGYEHDSYIHHLFCITTSKLDNDAIWPADSAAYESAVEGWEPLHPFCAEGELTSQSNRQPRFSHLCTEVTA